MFELTVKEALLQASSLLAEALRSAGRAEEDRAGSDPGQTVGAAGVSGQGGAEASVGEKGKAPDATDGRFTGSGGYSLAEEARADAEVLLMHVLGWDKTRLLLEGNSPFPAELAERWQECLERRMAGEPVQYITGVQAFYGMDFDVGPEVLIPRPETELLVEAVAGRVRELFGVGATGTPRKEIASEGAAVASNGSGGAGVVANRTRDGADWPLIADIGTGSGAIAVTLARLLPGWRVAACDLSPAALEVARRNAERAEELFGAAATPDAPGARGVAGGFGTSGTGGDPERSGPSATSGRADAAGTPVRLIDRLRFMQGDLLEPLLENGERVDVLVSNPPYIASEDIPNLERKVRDYEPRLALDGGPDGLDVYRRLIRQMNRLSEPPKLVAFEVGQGQARQVAAMLAETGHWPEGEIIRDYAGIERHVLAWRKSD